MAARTRLPLLFPRNLRPFRDCRHVHSEAAVKEPNYPPIVPSLTAKSKSARRRQADEHIKKICASPVDEKLSLVTRAQRMKFVVYPQTFARNADTWYQHFTKTAYVPGLPEKFAAVVQDTASEDGSTQAAARTIVPGLPDDVFADIRSLVTRVILHEHWHLKKGRAFLYRKQEHMVAPLLRNLVSGLTYSLAKYNPLLLQSSLGIIFDSLILIGINWACNLNHITLLFGSCSIMRIYFLIKSQRSGVVHQSQFSSSL